MKRDDLDRIVREAFGRDCGIDLCSWEDKTVYYIIQWDYCGEAFMIGHLGKDNDGSEIVIDEAFLIEAENYQRLYEESTGKTAMVKVRDFGGRMPFFKGRAESLECKEESKPKFINPFEVDLGY